MQGDRNLVMKRWDGTTRWAAPATGLQAVMQHDGNFVMYGAYGATWNTETWGNPGSFLSLQDDGNLVVYSSTGRPLWNIGADRYTADNPNNPGNIVGRDLDVAGLGAIGHVGVWDGNEVAEVVNGQSNAARFVSIESFKGATRYWGVSRPAIPGGLLSLMCFNTVCSTSNPSGWERIDYRASIQKRARQIRAIGADYTLVPSNTRLAYPRRDLSAAIRGLYRCDTFVPDVVGQTRYRDNPNAVESNWWRHVNSIENGVMLPLTIYNRFAEFR
jgi:hypothetical protein